MDREKLVNEYGKLGFSDVKTNIPGINILFRAEGLRAEVCVIVDNTAAPYMDGSQMQNIKRQLETRLLTDHPDNPGVLFILLTDSVERERHTAESGISVWIVDVHSRRLIIYENQPEDYARSRTMLENFLGYRDVKKEQKMRAVKADIPIVNILLVAANIIVFILLEIAGSTEDTYFMLAHGAAFGDYIFNGNEYYRLFTSTFIHFGAYHLVSNMITLILIGNRAERILGSFKYLVIYIASGVGASLVSSAYYYVQGDMVVSGGASGAIFGVIGALLVLIIKNRRVFGGVMKIQFILFVLLVLYNGFMNVKIDVAAHLAGLVLGIVLTHLLTRKHAGKMR
ncbi:rhomboid family intramembrane serine protease [Parasporobacterium paucivorans]|uniref:Rhomboid family protein n=1 Tax=Parasporobacterium paucivorans DSM 15970 TaxID=1122934 RepID=A0A1M6JA20_9FIRM|nr:rhomboid family intramembrane serine protease [Parasporobacterium paucivorans]SHJ43474.1 Rhomboid family protein [Parasporobacterium paucivorans DSM 15970]